MAIDQRQKQASERRIREVLGTMSVSNSREYLLTPDGYLLMAAENYGVEASQVSMYRVGNFRMADRAINFTPRVDTSEPSQMFAVEETLEAMAVMAKDIKIQPIRFFGIAPNEDSGSQNAILHDIALRLTKLSEREHK